MQYIVTKRFKTIVESGPINLSYGTQCECRNGRIYYGNRFIVRERSRLAHTNFARNDDGMGVERGELTRKIEVATARASAETMHRIEKSELCQSYRKQEHLDVWLWSHKFFTASLPTLISIAKIVGVKP